MSANRIEQRSGLAKSNLSADWMARTNLWPRPGRWASYHSAASATSASVAGSFLRTCISQALAQAIEKTVVPRSRKRGINQILDLAAQYFPTFGGFDIACIALRHQIG